MKCTLKHPGGLIGEAAGDHEQCPFLNRVWYWLQPKNYLDFITNYKRSLAAQRKDISDTCNRLSNGLTKLVQASAEVDVLQKELNKAKVVVEAATQECNQLLEVCSKHTMLQSWYLRLEFTCLTKSRLWLSPRATLT
jgi:type I site-specific restriction endonuclease